MSRLSSDDWLALREIARRSISSAVVESCIPELPSYSPALQISRGAFVTLYRGGKLRGCMGQVEDLGPLAEVVARAAISAALHDPRFPPVATVEMASLEIELSVLSPLKSILPEAIVAGKHGLVVSREQCRAVLLPQVAIERGWSAQKFLEQTCEKAGLPPHAWRDPATRIRCFTAQVYPEGGIRAMSLDSSR
jgi:AmmeMemoRadiSam system protein A